MGDEQKVVDIDIYTGYFETVFAGPVALVIGDNISCLMCSFYGGNSFVITGSNPSALAMTSVTDHLHLCHTTMDSSHKEALLERVAELLGHEPEVFDALSCPEDGVWEARH